MMDAFIMPYGMSKKNQVIHERILNALSKGMEIGNIDLGIEEYKNHKQTLYDKLPKYQQLYAKYQIIAIIQGKYGLSFRQRTNFNRRIDSCEIADRVIDTKVRSMRLVDMAELGLISPCSASKGQG